MEHHTTLNLELMVYQELKELAAQKGISVDQVIVALMKFVSCEAKHRKMPERLVEYQKLSEGGEWYTCHVYWCFPDIKALLALLAGFDTCAIVALRINILQI